MEKSRHLSTRFDINMQITNARQCAHVPRWHGEFIPQEIKVLVSVGHTTWRILKIWLFPSNVLRDCIVRLVALCGFKTQFHSAAIACVIACPWVCLHIILQLIWLSCNAVNNTQTASTMLNVKTKKTFAAIASGRVDHTITLFFPWQKKRVYQN